MSITWTYRWLLLHQQEQKNKGQMHYQTSVQRIIRTPSAYPRSEICQSLKNGKNLWTNKNTNKRQTKNIDKVQTKEGNFNNTLRAKPEEKISRKKNLANGTGYMTGASDQQKDKQVSCACILWSYQTNCNSNGHQQ